MPKKQPIIEIPGVLQDRPSNNNYNSDEDQLSDAEDTSNTSDTVNRPEALTSDDEDETGEFFPELDNLPPLTERNLSPGRQKIGKNGKTELNPADIYSPDVLLNRADRLSHKFAKRGQPNNALRQLIRKTALSVLVYGPEHYKYAESYTDLAKGYLDLKGSNFALQAEEHGTHSINILLAATNQLPTSETERLELLQITLKTYHTLGRAQAILKKNTEAEQSLIKAEKLLSQISKLSAASENYITETKVRLFSSLAKINSKLNKPAMAVSYYESAITVVKKYWGAQSEELITLYQCIGAVEQGRIEFPNHDKAIEMYLQAHQIAAASSVAKSSKSIADTARALATAYSKTGDPIAETSAESYLQEALNTYIQIDGPDSATAISVQEDLAKLRLRQDNTEEGLRLLRQLLPPLARLHGDYSIEVLETYQLIGSVLLATGDLEKALKSLYKALDIAEVLFAPKSPKSRELNKMIETILAHPSMVSKQTNYDIKSRPKFNGIVARSKPVANGNAGVFN